MGRNFYTRCPGLDKVASAAASAGTVINTDALSLDKGDGFAFIGEVATGTGNKAIVQFSYDSGTNWVTAKQADEEKDATAADCELSLPSAATFVIEGVCPLPRRASEVGEAGKQATHVRLQIDRSGADTATDAIYAFQWYSRETKEHMPAAQVAFFHAPRIPEA